MDLDQKSVFISADHGLAIVYFLQTDVVPTLVENGCRVVILTDEGLKDQINQKFGKPGVQVEGLRLREAQRYAEAVSPSMQYWQAFLRRAGSSDRINKEAQVSYIRQVEFESAGRRRMLLPAMKMLVGLLKKSSTARKLLVNSQMRFAPEIYTDLFERYQPSLVVASTPGWRYDRYLLRQAARRGIRTAAVIVGWDNPSSYALPGAPVDAINCWSEVQKHELVDGSDWQPHQVHIGGIPSYDGYFRRQWLMSRDEYFQLHRLDPQRRLLGYACSFITFSPNYQNIEALAHMVASDALAQPAQLLIRLHPNHFMKDPLYAGERERIFQLAQTLPHIHVVEPVPLGGELGYYSGEDMPEKTSMMAYSDVFLTVYSTMVVEAAIHDRPIIGVCIDAPGGWNTKGKFSLPLSEIGEWPTHQRFRRSGAGQVATNEEELHQHINRYLQDPMADSDQRRKFVRDEVTFTDGSAGKHSAQFLLSLLRERI